MEHLESELLNIADRANKVNEHINNIIKELKRLANSGRYNLEIEYGNNYVEIVNRIIYLIDKHYNIKLESDFNTATQKDIYRVKLNG